MKTQTTMRFGIFVVLLCTAVNSHTQQNIEKIPNQVKKGKWMISHDIFYLAYFNNKNRTYDDNGNLTGSEKDGRFYSSIAMVSPSWGSMGLTTGKTHRYGASGVELEAVKSNTWTVGVTPSIGRFIRDRLLLTALVQVYFSRDQYTYNYPNGFQEYDYKYTTVGIGPEIRYYFGKLVNNRLLHAGIATNFVYRINKQNATTTFNGSTPDERSNIVKQPEFRVEPYLGSSWFAGKHWTFTGTLFFRTTSGNYKIRVNDSSGPSRANTKNTRNDMGFRAGINYTFK